MPSELYRPPPPDLAEWEGTMEKVLIESVRPRPVRPRRRIMEILSRWGRTLARRIGHGLATVTAAALAVAVALPPLAMVEPPTGSEPAILAAEVAPEADIGAVSGNTFLGAKPKSPLHDLLAADDSNRLPADIELAQPGLTSEPQSDARAVPTPDGGGSATVALRPTVR